MLVKNRRSRTAKGGEVQLHTYRDTSLVVRY